MRRFVLEREGRVVAEGVQASNERAAVLWQAGPSSTVAWDSIEDAREVHGHAGSTFRWIDDEFGMPYRHPAEMYRQQRMAP